MDADDAQAESPLTLPDPDLELELGLGSDVEDQLLVDEPGWVRRDHALPSANNGTCRLQQPPATQLHALPEGAQMTAETMPVDVMAERPLAGVPQSTTEGAGVQDLLDVQSRHLADGEKGDTSPAVKVGVCQAGAALCGLQWSLGIC
jgi:hypothetical protein